MGSKKITYLSLLTTIALIIFVIELRIPNIVPIYGVKLGLANIVTVYAMYHCSCKETFMVVFVRVFLGSLFGGNVSALIYSFAGAMFCLVGMMLLKRFFDEKHIWICSVIGAVLHNIGQILAAIIVMRTTSVVYYLPFLLVSGCIAGAFTGITAQFLINRSRRK